MANVVHKILVFVLEIPIFFYTPMIWSSFVGLRLMKIVPKFRAKEMFASVL